MNTYHVVSNAEGFILAVFGEKLLSDAQSQAKTIQSNTGCFTYLHSIACDKRPRMGQFISMKNSKRVA